MPAEHGNHANTPTPLLSKYLIMEKLLPLTIIEKM
jgi:hypothetical protein